eukprot:CAMPEP_0119378842 /NCGR_PEP_ID=MMETSP1334-20130426/50237_1 /TAXON_ID=127549 /ORGANISM="Calcidiscus leptoporus, Strain RCC1130" /LENGTH=203 /DNA_ID=CAMNT_0007398185 /DNA_START=86 /DNA_END=697 /DNA_ORIENTATION=-
MHARRPSRDGQLDKRELFGFHAKKLGIDLSDTSGTDEDDEKDAGTAANMDDAEANEGWGWARRSAYPRGHHGEEEEEERWGSAAPHNAEYAAHNETFDWHDSNGDGLLDHEELGLYLLPASSTVHEGYAEEESFRLLELLRAARLMADSPGSELNSAALNDAGEPQESFALDHVLKAGSQFLAAFDSSFHTFMQDFELDERDL